MFFKISQVFSNFYKNGNCKFYIIPKYQSNTVQTYILRVGPDGKLLITTEVEEYNKPINKELLEKKEDAPIDKLFSKICTPEEYPEVIAHLIDASLFEVAEYFFETKKSTEDISTDLALNELYQMLRPFLEMPESEFGRFAKSSYDYSNIINFLVFKGRTPMEPSPLIAGKYLDFTVEYEFAEFYAKFRKARLIWYKIRNAQTEEEYQQACSEWDSMYENPTPVSLTK